MNLLFRVIFAHSCRSTHHKMAMDALCHLQSRHTQRWQQLFLKYHQAFLEGAKAPDTQFRDFRNHVLHVHDNYWGGAAKTARKWYAKTVHAMQYRDWEAAAFNAGVLSHYYTDPIQPFHTAQSKAESRIHRAAEWSITKSYDTIQSVIRDGTGYPCIEVPDAEDWLEQMVVAGAELSNQYYEPLIERYDFRRGRSNPPEGLDQESREFLAELIAHATIGFARILDRAVEESDETPPLVDVSLRGFLAVMQIPVRWVTKKMHDRQEQILVEAIYDELQSTGEVNRTLPEDDRAVRKLHQKEVIEGHRSAKDDYVPPARRVMREPAAARSQHSTAGSVQATPSVQAPVEPPSAHDALDQASNRHQAAKDENQQPSEFGAARPLDSAPADRLADPRVGQPGLQQDEAPSNRRRRNSRRKERRSRATSDQEIRRASTTVETHSDAAPADKPQRGMADARSEPRSPDATPDEAIASGVDDHDNEGRPSRAAQLRFHLNVADDIVDAPSIGPKTAARFKRIGIKTVAELLAASPQVAAKQISTRHITADTICRWQDQARLACQIPEIRGHDAQILVACGWTDPHAIADADPAQLLAAVAAFVDTSDGKRIVRSGRGPDLAEVTAWVDWAGQSRQLRAA